LSPINQEIILKMTNPSKDSQAPFKVEISIQDEIATVTFFSNKANSLPPQLLSLLKKHVQDLGHDPKAKVIILQSFGEGAFCAGASLSEMEKIKNLEEGTDFFFSFASLLMAIKDCPKFIICRVQGKAVGGGVGLISACDYILATSTSEVRLSELDVGLGPFVISPFIRRKIGESAFQEMTIDAEWKSADWCAQKGLFNKICNSVSELDKAVLALANKLSSADPHAMSELKRTYWSENSFLEREIRDLAKKSSRLVLENKNFKTK
jgi:methylglutaconyl-CoA hydratase